MTNNTAQLLIADELRTVPAPLQEAAVIRLPITSDDQGTLNIKMPPPPQGIFKGRDNDCL